MKLETVSIPVQPADVEARIAARAKFLDYRRAVAIGAHGDEQRAADAVLMRGYREILRGRPVLDLVDVMRATGVTDRWYPKLAIVRADARTVRVRMNDDGSARFYADRDQWARGKKHKIEVPVDTFGRYRVVYQSSPLPSSARERYMNSWVSEADAIVPTIPPKYRPKGQLDAYCLLWEAVWSPAPPLDPLLLKPLGGTLYAVMAQWDLSPLERAVLNGRL